MSFDVIYGKVTDSIKQSNFVRFVKKYFEQSGDDGTLYLGYSLTKDAEEMLTADALLIGKNCGVVAFSFPEEKDVQKIYDAQDALFYQLDFYFKRYPTLRKERGLFFEFRVVSIVPAIDFEVDEKFFVSTADNLPQFLSEGENLSEESYHRICEALQKLTGMKPAKERSNVQNFDSMGGKLKELERQIANMDIWQQKAAMENIEGPQRIRGLAGSGKTIILAWKAAYLHAIHPDWDIAVTFFSRSLYQQFQELITRFYYLHSPNQLNWEKIQVLHSWGGWGKSGIYYKASRIAGVSPVNYSDAKSKYGMDGAFAGICKELNERLTSENPLFDAVLIDKAQDLPESFFKIIYKLTKPPKRIIWAYDELQNIKNVAVPSAKVMFGISDEEEINFSLDNIEDEATKDNILRVCYRNPKWSLAVAHALGFGIYRKSKDNTSGIVQMFDEPKIWESIGYQCISGELE